MRQCWKPANRLGCGNCARKQGFVTEYGRQGSHSQSAGSLSEKLPPGFQQNGFIKRMHVGSP
jgi:hypothetical protein